MNGIEVTVPELAEYIKLGFAPVSSQSSAGETIDFDDQFEELKNEIRKLDSVTQTSADWNKVVELSSALLAKSKTFSVGTYLCLGLLETKSYTGLAAGLEICRDLVKNFWESGFPPPARIKGRIEPFAWLSERGARAVEKQKGSSSDLESVKKSITLLNELSGLLQEKLANNQPGFGDLSRALNERVSSLEVKARPQPSPSTSYTPAASDAQSGELFPDEIKTAEEVEKVFPKLQQALRQIADVWRSADPTDPRPYHLARSAFWGHIAEPPAGEDGQTSVPGIGGDLTERWESLLSEEEFGAVLEAAESYFGETLFWLDLHRYVVKAMDGLGSEYARARAAVMGELKNFVNRLPGVPELKFVDGLPFASDETRKWIQTEVLAGGAAPSIPDPAVSSASAASEKLAETIKKAGELAKKKKLGEAVNLFQEGIRTRGEKRERFMWRLGLARFCLSAKLPHLAIPHLEQLEREIGKHLLEDWEPRLSLEALTLLYQSYQRALKEDKGFADTEEKAQKLFARLCQLDPMMALNLEKK